MAEYEADNTGERIRLVNEYKVRTGQALTGHNSQGIAFTVKRTLMELKEWYRIQILKIFVWITLITF